MLRPDSAFRRDIVADAAIGIIAEEGLAGFTVRNLARHLQLTSAGLHHWVGSRSTMLVTVTATIGQRMIAWTWGRSLDEGALAFLPRTEHEIAWMRVWLSLHELARTDAELAESITFFRNEERAILARRCPDLPDDLLESATALVTGLRVAVCLRDHPLAPATARAELRARLHAWSPNG